MFSAFVQYGLLVDLTGYYDRQQRRRGRAGEAGPLRGAGGRWSGAGHGEGSRTCPPSCCPLSLPCRLLSLPCPAPAPTWVAALDRFFAVVSTGRSATAGHPGILHGGLTAALVDESLGGLMFALIKHGALESKGPWFTVRVGAAAPAARGPPVCALPHAARLRRRRPQLLACRPDTNPRPASVRLQAQLNVSYKRKIDAGAAVLCTTEVESLEGRKLWMKAVVRRGRSSSIAPAWRWRCRCGHLCLQSLGRHLPP